MRSLPLRFVFFAIMLPLSLNGGSPPFLPLYILPRFHTDFKGSCGIFTFFLNLSEMLEKRQIMCYNKIV